MKSRPIIFTGESIPQILARQKTQTRRVCRDQTPSSYRWVDDFPTVPNAKPYTGWAKEIPELSILVPTRCPYGVPGDTLWVRETCRAERFPHGGYGVAYLADEQYQPIEKTAGDENQWVKLWNYRDGANILDGVGQTVPSIHMPRWASRISLEVTDVRVELVQDISTDDVKSEGLRYSHEYLIPEFRIRWNTFNHKRGYGWDVNPHVWCVTFKLLDGKESANG